MYRIAGYIELIRAFEYFREQLERGIPKTYLLASMNRTIHKINGSCRKRCYADTSIA